MLKYRGARRQAPARIELNGVRRRAVAPAPFASVDVGRKEEVPARALARPELHAGLARWGGDQRGLTNGESGQGRSPGLRPMVTTYLLTVQQVVCFAQMARAAR